MTRFSLNSNFWCDSRSASSSCFIGRTHFFHYISVGFFENKIWIHSIYNLVHEVSGVIDVVNGSQNFADPHWPIQSPERASKLFMDPFHGFKMGVGNRDNTMPIFSTGLPIGVVSDIETTLPVNEASQVSPFRTRDLLHNNLCIVCDHGKLNIYFSHAERLNEKASAKRMRKSALDMKIREGDPKRFPRHENGQYGGSPESNSAVLNEQASLLAQAMRETEDELTFNMLSATASQINCQNGGGTDNPTPLSGADFDGAIVALINARASMISDHIEGSLKFGTAPIRDSFWCLMHSAMIPSLESVSGFISMAQYPAAMNILNYEWGSYKNLRFLYTAPPPGQNWGLLNPSASKNGADIYNNYIMGKEAYACIDLTEATSEFIYTPPGGPGDPLRQRQACGYKFAQVPRILNDAWIENLRATI